MIGRFEFTGKQSGEKNGASDGGEHRYYHLGECPEVQMFEVDYEADQKQQAQANKHEGYFGQQVCQPVRLDVAARAVHQPAHEKRQQYQFNERGSESGCGNAMVEGRSSRAEPDKAANRADQRGDKDKEGTHDCFRKEG